MVMDKRAEDLESDLKHLVEVARCALTFARLNRQASTVDLLRIALNEDRYLIGRPYISDAEELERAEKFLKHARDNEWDSKP